jgi:hypothetical protein
MYRRDCLRFLLLMSVLALHAVTARADILSNLVGFWRFDDGSGTTAADSSGNGNQGTLVNAPTWIAPGRVGAAALSFSGNYVTAGQNGALDVSSNVLTLAAWVRRETSSAEGFIATRGTDGIAGYAFALGGAGCGANQIRLSKYYIAHLCLGDFPADTNWHHVAVVAGEAGVISYVGGISVGSDPDVSDFVTAPGATFYIGTYDGADGMLAADIDELRVYDRALAPADIVELCACGGSSGTWTHEPAGFTVVEETGWESGTLDNWTLIHTDPNKPITVAAITDSMIGESKAVQIEYPADHVGGGGTELRYEIAVQDRSTEMFLGYYVQVNENWKGHESAIQKMVYLSDDPIGFSAMWYEMFGADDEDLGLYVVNQSGSSPESIHADPPVTFTRGQWHKVEIYQKQGINDDGIIRVWVNDVLAIDRSDVNTRNEAGQPTPFDNVTISGIWGGIDGIKGQTDYMKFDRIRISRP